MILKKPFGLFIVFLWTFSYKPPRCNERETVHAVSNLRCNAVEQQIEKGTHRMGCVPFLLFLFNCSFFAFGILYLIFCVCVLCLATNQNPRFSPTRNTLMRPLWRLRLVITIWLQIQSSQRQSPQLPVTAQGVFLFRRMVFGGLAIFCVLESPLPMSVTTLFIPAMIKTCFGP